VGRLANVLGVGLAARDAVRHPDLLVLAAPRRREKSRKDRDRQAPLTE
jgi:hypothetical protein